MGKRSQLKPGSKSGDSIYVNNHIFLGRVEEQKQFGNVLGEVLNTTDEKLPWAVLLYGDGGMGKTTLAARFRDIARGEEPFAGAFETLQIDWEELRRRHVSLQANRESITPEAVFDALHAAIPQDWKGHFNKYQEAVKLRAEAEKKASEAMSAAGERDSLSELRGLGVGALAKLARQSAPIIGETGEKAVKVLSELGIKVAEDQARNVINSLNTRLRAMLRPGDGQSFDLDARLRDLERDYASVHSDENRLHDAPALFFRERLKRSRDEDWAQALNRRAVETLRARLRKLEAGLPRLEDRCEDEDWTRTAVALADHLWNGSNGTRISIPCAATRGLQN